LGTDCDDLGCDQGQQVRCREISEAVRKTPAQLSCQIKYLERFG
jgi:hypothetical protein